jgi:uroporphyrinogen-III synthase
MPLTVEGIEIPLAWRAHLAAAAVGAIDEKTREAVEARGFTVATVPETPGDEPPAAPAPALARGG